MIDSTQFNDPVVPLVGNCRASSLTTGAEVKAELQKQLTSCVQWQRSVSYMIDEGVEKFIEIGPGKVLSGMIKRIDRSVPVTALSDMESIKAFAA